MPFLNKIIKKLLSELTNTNKYNIYKTTIIIHNKFYTIKFEKTLLFSAKPPFLKNFKTSLCKNYDCSICKYIIPFSYIIN